MRGTLSVATNNKDLSSSGKEYISLTLPLVTNPNLLKLVVATAIVSRRLRVECVTTIRGRSRAQNQINIFRRSLDLNCALTEWTVYTPISGRRSRD